VEVTEDEKCALVSVKVLLEKLADRDGLAGVVVRVLEQEGEPAKRGLAAAPRPQRVQARLRAMAKSQAVTLSRPAI
jgi:hypothetical protein